MTADLAVLAALLLCLAGLCYSLFRQGGSAVENKLLQKAMDDVEKANNARDALEHDPAAAQRVRDRFTR